MLTLNIWVGCVILAGADRHCLASCAEGLVVLLQKHVPYQRTSEENSSSVCRVLTKIDTERCEVFDQ